MVAELGLTKGGVGEVGIETDWRCQDSIERAPGFALAPDKFAVESENRL